MALIKGEKVYRNLQEQVYENTCDIQELLRMYGYHGPYTSTDIIPNDDLYNRAMYLIGTGMPYKVYQYSDLTKRFTYIGDYNMDVGPEGPPGPQGPQGERGPAGKPASEIVNIETYDVVYKKDVTESKVRANFDDGHSNEFSVYAKNGESDISNLIAGRGITVEHNSENTATISVDDTIIDTDKLNDKLNEELPKKQDKLTPGKNISIVDNVISSTGGLDGVVGGTGITVENTADDKAIVNISSDIINKIDDLETNKQDTITDLDNIRDGAAKGSTAIQPTDLDNYVTLNTDQTITAKKIFADDRFDGGIEIKSTDTSDQRHVLLGNQGVFVWDGDIDNDHKIARAYSDEFSLIQHDKKLDGILNLKIWLKNNRPEIIWDNDLTKSYFNYRLPHYNESVGDQLNRKIYTLATTSDIAPLATKDELSTELAKKQDVIDDLDAIRDGAAKGETALQSAMLDDYAKKSDIPDVSGKLDKVTAATSTAQVYYKAANGTNTMRDCNTGAVTTQSIMMRDTTGHCKIVDPVADSDIANKKYVDDNISNMVTTDDVQTITGPKTFQATVTAPNLTAQGTNQSTVYGSVQIVHTFDDNTKLNLQYPKKSGNQTIATVSDLNTGLSGKLDKVTDTTELGQVYYKESNGANGMINCNTLQTSLPSLLMRDEYGNCKIVDPLDEWDIANKRYVDNLVSNLVSVKLDKPTNAPDQYHINLMSIDHNGENKQVQATKWTEADVLVLRDAYGQISVPYKPDQPYDATSKKYVDDSIPDVSNMVTTDTEQTINANKTINGTFSISRADGNSTALRIYNDQTDNISFAGWKTVDGTNIRTWYNLPLYDTKTSKTIATTDDIYYQNGEKFTNTGFYNANGYLTGAGKQIGFTIILPKNLKNIKSVTVNKLSCNIRGIGGYLNGSSYIDYKTQSGITINAYKSADNAVFIQIVMSDTTWGGTNNTPVAVAFTNGGLDITLNS